MKIKEFTEAYDLHDSFIESIEHTEKSKDVILTIHFAFWRQDWYVKGDPENGVIRTVFHNVFRFDYEGGDPQGAFVGILRSEYRDGSIILVLSDEEAMSYFDLSISAEEVSVVVL